MSTDSVRIWEEDVVFPTYPVLEADRVPMFLEKRVNQGTSGRTYPLPVYSRLSDEKVDQTYKAVWIENEFVRVMTLPQLGGRIMVGEDKSNGYNFFYRQNVIKPALIGLNGPWISGGVEFNWPQHHRPTTYVPVDYHIEEHPDGSKTVWMGEIEPLYRMKGMVGITLHPGRSIVEARGQLFNRTPFPQPFMWWANVAMLINDETQAFFPMDVHYVTDHARRAMSDFPIATGSYYGVDYAPGTDITWTKNMTSAGSYFVLDTDYDFSGGYDHGRQAGLVYVADRFIAPGKKMFNWGNWDGGHRWQRNLTDADGEYVELMAGVYTDNQPDFSWMQPYEMRQFSQFWYPIQQIGTAQNANLEAAIALKVADGSAHVGAHVTDDKPGCVLVVKVGGEEVWRASADLAPATPYVGDVALPAKADEFNTSLWLYANDGSELIHYVPPAPWHGKIPEAYQPAPLPEEIATNEELYLAGLHLEQYRHPTRDPEPYYEEALDRDPDDVRANNALGLLRMRRGQFLGAEAHFRRAIARLIRYNPNPYDGEPSYNLGLACQWQGKLDEAYAAFYKATWNQAWAAAAFLGLARIDCRRGEFQTALAHIQKALVYHSHNLSALGLYAAILRHLDRLEEAVSVSTAAHALDPLDYLARFEQGEALHALDAQAEADTARAELRQLMRGNPQSHIELALEYAAAGLYNEATRVLTLAVEAADAAAQPVWPLVYYLLADIAERSGQREEAKAYGELAAQMPSDLCFPARLEEMQALEAACERNPADARAPYYLGNLLYDKQRQAEAMQWWEQARRLDPTFPIVHRNLALGYANLGGDPQAARAALETAVRLDSSDPRTLLELVILMEQTGATPQERLALLEEHRATVQLRDDLTLEYIALLNATRQYAAASALFETRIFHPWEGGEGLSTLHYVWAHLAPAVGALQAGDLTTARAAMDKALQQPESLGEGRTWGHPQSNLFYYTGLLCEAEGDADAARGWFEQAAASAPWGVSEFTFFKGLALLKLGKQKKARKLFEGMIEHSKAQMKKAPVKPYFTSSEPLFQLPQAERAARAKQRAHLLLGLAYSGLGKQKKARKHLADVLPLAHDPHGVMAALEG